MFRLFECCALSFFERFVLSFSLKIERFVSDSAEIWICGLYIDMRRLLQLVRKETIIPRDLLDELEVWGDRKSTRLNSSPTLASRMPSSA